MEAVRLPLTSAIETRDSTTNKDSLTKNCIFEPGSDGTTNVVKRPGLDLKISATGRGNGVFFHKGKTWVFTLAPFFAGFQLYSNNSVVVGTLQVNSPTEHYYVKTNQTSLKSTTNGIKIRGYDGTYFLGAEPSGGNENMFRSVDGFVWTDGQLLAGSFVAPGGSLVSSGAISRTPTEGNYRITSNNGLTWVNGFQTIGLVSLAANSTRFTIGLSYSSNGSSWTACTGAVAAYAGLCWCGTFFWGYTSTTSGGTSPDGIAWTAQTLSGIPVGFSAKATIWNGSKLFIINSNYEVCTSSDGITFTYHGFIDTELQGVGASFLDAANITGNIYITARKTTDNILHFYTSSTGSSWTKIPIQTGRVVITEVVG